MKYREIYLFALGRSGSSAVLYWINANTKVKSRVSTKDGYIRYFEQKSRCPVVIKQGTVSLKQFKILSEQNPHRDTNKIITYVLRDPFNLFASQIRSWGVAPSRNWVRKTINDIQTGWIEFATEALSLSSYLPSNSIFVNYNKWFSERPYRDKLAKSLGLSCKDKSINKVTKHGAGSSFDKTRYNGKAQNMDVLNRWKTYAGDQFYLSMFNKQILKLSKKLFGPTPPFNDPSYKVTNDPKDRHYLKHPHLYI